MCVRMYSCVTCALHCVCKFLFLYVCCVYMSVLEIKFVWEIEKERLKDGVKEVKIDRYRER